MAATSSRSVDEVDRSEGQSAGSIPGQRTAPPLRENPSVTDGDAAVRRLLGVRQHQQNGHRSPHKPLLILMALGNLAATGSSRVEWSDAETRLAALLTEFGSPKGERGAGGAAYPFTRLRGDGFWTLSRDVPNDRVGDLRAAPVYGQFDPRLDDALLGDPDLIRRAALEVTLGQFPASMVADVLEAVGLEAVAPRDSVVAVGESPRHRDRRRRSAAWRQEILDAWDRSCAFCGYDGSLGGTPVGLEAAHVRWFNFDGPDELDNGVALCSLHHKLLDRGALGFASPDVVVVSKSFTARGSVARSIYDLHRRRLRPRVGTALPAESHVSWHCEQVFREPALT